ncbi:MAG: hypothetical protein M1833_000678 [Piccolia ochrophora]|nr:MAG: hypothetical protein M1833_000678 [Piccolia ochrophora]
MQTSQVFKASTLCAPSPDGTLVAALISSKLILRSTSSWEVVRSITVNPDFASRVQYLQWSPYDSPSEEEHALSSTEDSLFDVLGAPHSPTYSPSMGRVLLADENTVRVWDTRDPQWLATIENACGGLCKIANVEFGGSEDEVIVFSENGLKVTVWSLVTGRNYEIKDPKFSKRAHTYRPRTGQCALLTRPAAHDVITIHDHPTYRIFKYFMSATTDAQGLKWSPCGRWLTVWDSAASGYKLVIYTADGHMFRVISSPAGGTGAGLGIKTVQWSPSASHLAIGDYANRVSVLDHTISTKVHIQLEHPDTLVPKRVAIFQEQVSPTQQRNYVSLFSPSFVPSSTPNPGDPNPKIGISTLAFSCTSQFLAVVSDLFPSTVWIFDIAQSRPRTVALLIHTSPLKQIAWHPTIPDLLLLQCAQDDSVNANVVYLWSDAWDRPRIFPIPLDQRPGSKPTARWIRPNDSHGTPPTATLLYSDATSYVIASIEVEPHDPRLTVFQAKARADDERKLSLNTHEGKENMGTEVSPVGPGKTDDLTSGLVTDGMGVFAGY